MTRNSIHGLLLEGVDYSGKTSVANAVSSLVEASGKEVARRNCFVNNHPIMQKLIEQASTSPDMEKRDIFYTSSLLHDLMLPELSLSDHYLIQERHVLTQIGRNLFFHSPGAHWHIDDFWRLRRPFSHQVYLTSDIDSKRTRTRRRPPKSPRDEILANDALLHQRYDDAMLKILPEEERWLVIDTSKLDVQEVAVKIFEFLKEDCLG